jgi:hypothetical protein
MVRVTGSQGTASISLFRQMVAEPYSSIIPLAGIIANLLHPATFSHRSARCPALITGSCIGGSTERYGEFIVNMNQSCTYSHNISRFSHPTVCRLGT